VSLAHALRAILEASLGARDEHDAGRRPHDRLRGQYDLPVQPSLVRGRIEPGNRKVD